MTRATCRRFAIRAAISSFHDNPFPQTSTLWSTAPENGSNRYVDDGLSFYERHCARHFPVDIRERFGRNVRTLRKAADIAQDEFADMAGVHRTYMSGIERGRRAPTIIIVERIARALKVSAGDLLDDPLDRIE